MIHGLLSFNCSVASSFWTDLPCVVPFSGGSSLEGNFSAPYGGMSIDFSFMDQVLQIHEAEYVQPLSRLCIERGLCQRITTGIADSSLAVAWTW